MEELKSLRAENDYLKVVRLNSKRSPGEKEKVITINELRQKHDLSLLLKHASMARSSFYYHIKRSTIPDKCQEIKTQIGNIYHRHKGRFGYRCITMELSLYLLKGYGF